MDINPNALYVKLSDSVIDVQPILYFQLLSETAFAPTRNTPFSAGADLYSPYEVIIPPLGNKLIATNIRFIIPEGHYGRLVSTSAIRHIIS